MNKRQVGAVREAEAAAYLSENGYQVLEMNFRCRTGEIPFRDGLWFAV